MEQQIYNAWCLVQERKKLLHDRKEGLFKKQSAAKLDELLNVTFDTNSVNSLLSALDGYFELYSALNAELKQSLNCVALSDDIEVSNPGTTTTGVESGNELATCLDKSNQVLQGMCQELATLMDSVAVMKSQFTGAEDVVNKSLLEIRSMSEQKIPHLSNIESEHTSLMFHSSQIERKQMVTQNDNIFSFTQLRDSLGI